MTLLADLALCGPTGIQAWAATYGESTGNWWPPGASSTARGIVNAILRGPRVERLHVGGDRSTFFGKQIGTMCANWAAVSLIDEVLDEAAPETWGLSRDDFGRAAAEPRFSVVHDRFPAGWCVVEALGRCVGDGTNFQSLDLPEEGSSDEARAWLFLSLGAGGCG